MSDEEKQDNKVKANQHNLQELTTKEAEAHISASIDLGTNFFLFGQRGFGKSTICEEVVKSKGLKLVKKNLSVAERVDMGGYPNMMNRSKSAGKYIDYLLPRFFEPLIEGDEKVVVFFDEFDKSDLAILAPLLEFTQKREIDNVKLKNIQCILAAGNLISEGGNRPPPPLLDRVEKYMLTTNVTEWLAWATRSTVQIHESVITYLMNNGGDLISNLDAEDNYSGPCPRSWENVSNMQKLGEKLKISSNIIQQKVGGFVGHQTALNYEIYYAYYHEQMPLIDKVLNGENVISEFAKLEPTKQLTVCVMLNSRLAGMLDKIIEKKKTSKAKVIPLPKEAEHIADFFAKVDRETVFVAVRTQIGIDRIIGSNLDDNKHWKPVLHELRSLISPSEESKKD